MENQLCARRSIMPDKEYKPAPKIVAKEEISLTHSESGNLRRLIETVGSGIFWATRRASTYVNHAFVEGWRA